MKTTIQILLTALALTVSLAAQARGGHGGGHHGGGHRTHSSGTGASHASQHVSGYTKKSGMRVNAHKRSKADETQRNNWDTKGNVNPSTGKPGTKNADQ